MIEVNLLPGGAKKKAASAKSSIDFAAMASGLSAKFGDKVLIASIAIMVAAAGTGGWLYFKQGKDRTIAEERLDTALKDSTRFAGIVTGRLKLEAKRDTLLRQVNLIRAIDDDRYIWPHIMDEVSRVLPAYTWITIMGYAAAPAGSVNVVAAPVFTPNPADSGTKVKPKPKVPTAIPRDEITFRMTGRTVDLMAFTRFMQDLEASPFIGNVVMQGTTPGTDQGKELYQFQLILSYTRPDSSVIRRLPLVVTGR